MSLRGNPISETAMLPDGRSIRIDVGVARDPYVAERTDTVSVELHEGDVVLASLNTVLEPEQDSEARALAREIKAELESGEIEPTAGEIERLADQPR
ncbi:MAG: hypothetical protein MSC30_00320 [Gaiellaceae bacterium MAG52_C11]|nr:hypothetical protein [Candidatus Gaiellasilicea maunaloa]